MCVEKSKYFFYACLYTCGRVASQVRQLLAVFEVTGSIPADGTTF